MKTIHSLILLVVAIAVTTTHSSATIRRVNNQGFGANYTDLATCIGASSPNDTIHVEASGVGYGYITLNIPLTIIGPGYFLNENPGLQKNNTPATINKITINSGAAGTLITGIRVGDDGAARIYINASNIRIERCYIEDGITFQNTTTAGILNNISIKQCYCGDISVPSNVGPINNYQISNCYFATSIDISASGSNYQNNAQGNVTHCVFNGGVACWSANMDFKYNIIKGGTFQQNNNSITNVNYNLFVATVMPTWLDIPGNTNKIKSPVTAVFPNTTGSTDFKLNVNTIAQCPECYMTATNIQTGVFGGADPYKLSGIPNVPAIYMINAPSQSVQGGTINVNVSTRSND
jgi:hypothetical protein